MDRFVDVTGVMRLVVALFFLLFLLISAWWRISHPGDLGAPWGRSARARPRRALRAEPTARQAMYAYGQSRRAYDEHLHRLAAVHAVARGGRRVRA